MHLLVCGTETYLGPTRCQALHKGADGSSGRLWVGEKWAECSGDSGEAGSLEGFRRNFQKE